MILMIDNYDSFTYNLVHYLEQLGEEVVVVRNDKITLDEIEKKSPDHIVISPGPKKPEDAGISLEVIKKFHKTIPILGICLGHQGIIKFFGGEIIKGKEPVHGKVEKIINTNSGIFKGLPKTFHVTRYHSLIGKRETLPKELEITAETKDKIIMGVKHKEYRVEGVQFHPEAILTEYGLELLENFIRNNKR